MNSILLHLLDQSICIRLTQTLLHFLWQGLAIGLCTVLVAWMSRNASSRVRYGIHATSLVLMALCVPITFLLTNVTDSGLNDQEAVAFHESESLSLPSGMVQPALPQTGKFTPESSTDQSPLVISDAAGPIQSATLASVSDAENNVLARTRTRFESVIRPYAFHAACAYFLGVIAMLGRLCFALWGGHRLRRTATPIADRKLLQRIQLQARRIGLKAAPAIAYCDRIAVPVVAGILRPMILLPLWIATDMDPEQVLSILAHEMAHIRRFDSFVNLLQRMLETILFFHPAVWYISRQLSFERENCCDDAVVHAGCESVQYASALLRMAELCAAKHESISASSLATLAASGDSGSQLKRRIVRLIIGQQRLSLTRVDSLTLVLTATLIVGTMAGFWRHAVAAPPDKSDLTAAAALAPSSSDTTNAADRTEVEFSGKVVDMDGKPVIGAEIWFASAPYESLFADAQNSIRQVARSNDQGEFSLQLEPVATANKTINWTHFSFLIAKAPGYGCDGLPLAAFEKNPAPSTQRERLQQRIDQKTLTGSFVNHTLKLRPAVGPVRGRLVDLEGRPAVGVVVSVENLNNTDKSVFEEAFEKRTMEFAQKLWNQPNVPAGGSISQEDLRVLIPPVKTNDNGEFTLTGLGRDQMATVTLSGERVAADRFFIVGTEMPTASMPHLYSNGSQDVYTGLDFTYAVSPGVPVTGVVTEFQSGKPIAKAKVYVERLFSREGMQESSKLRLNTRHIHAETDEQGRFQLLGIPPGDHHVLEVDPPKSEPWLIASHELSIDPSQISAIANVQVFRGIWIEGRLTDEPTGEPIFGSVDYLALQKNPNTPKHFGLRDGWEIGRFPTDQLGRFRVVGLPGPGVLFARNSGSTVYPLSVGADKVDGFDPKRDYLPTTPTGMPLSNWNRVQQIDPPIDAQSYSIDLTLSAGSVLVGNVLEPNDSPASGVEVIGMVHKDSFFEPLSDNKFTIHNYESAVPRDLFFKAAKNSLVAHLHVEGTPPANLAVRLQPAVTVRGRLIETETNDEAVGYNLYCESSKLGRFRIDNTTRHGKMDSTITDGSGRFEVNGLLAGNVYKMDSFNAAHFSNQKNGFTIDLTNAKPGDVIELGDVTGKNAQPKTK